ncbi:MAG: hypothetical protein LBJ45_00745 [Holosporaceae bacterium]|jgi:hypothetical protein|nr:hypothetical protein [Holosporaceae bacterium]
MNTSVDRIEKEYFSIEDVVSYSNIEITHANDNKAPLKVMATKVIVWLVIISMIAALLLI